jgi:hypothetical protein
MKRKIQRIQPTVVVRFKGKRGQEANNPTGDPTSTFTTMFTTSSMC